MAKVGKCVSISGATEISHYVRWEKNGDHPNDGVATNPYSYEGKIVRYYRIPRMNELCKDCNAPMHKHGFIDDALKQTVHPGDYIVYLNSRNTVYSPADFCKYFKDVTNLPTFYGSIGDREDISAPDVKTSEFDYSYDEGTILKDFEKYLKSTYANHYGNRTNDDKHIDVIALAMADGSAHDFFKVSGMKYLSRFGKKDGANEKDLMKVLHCTILLIAESRASKSK